MWRVTMLLTRASDQSREQMIRGILDEYVPRLLANQTLTRRPLKKIDVNLPCDAASANVPNMFDASMEFWFDDEQAAGRALTLLCQDNELRAGVTQFVSRDKSVAWMGEYFPKLELDGVRLKLTVTGDVADGVAIQDALQYWSDVHPVVARTAPDFWAYLRLYAQVHGREVPGLSLYRPMAADVGFDSAEDFVTAYSHEQYLSIVRPDEIKFSKPGDMLAFATMDQRTVFARH